jgi:5-methylcytosine-specific restriction endonuclease McrA
MADPRGGAAYRAARATLKAEGHACWICRRPIDYTLRWPNPWSFTADHVVELDAGGHATDESNLRAAHARCNIIRGNHYRQGRPRLTERPERQW